MNMKLINLFKKTSFPEDLAIVYGDNNKVKLWTKSLKSPVLINNPTADVAENYIPSLVNMDGRILNSDFKGNLFDTLSGDEIFSHDRILMGLSVLEGRLIGMEGRAASPEKNGYLWIHLIDIEAMKNLYWYKPDFNNKATIRCIEDMKVLGSDIYFSSQEVFKISRKGNRYNMTRITDYLEDHVKIISDGKEIYAIKYHNEESSPDGTEMIRVSDNKRVAYWPMNGKKGFGSTHKAVMDNNVVILGNYFYGSPKNITGGKIFFFEMDVEMSDAKTGKKVEPRLLINNAFEREIIYSNGNPMITITADQAENILKDLKI